MGMECIEVQARLKYESVFFDCCGSHVSACYNYAQTSIIIYYYVLTSDKFLN